MPVGSDGKIALAGLGIAVALACAAITFGQQPMNRNPGGGQSPRPGSKQTTPTVVGARHCSSCHSDAMRYKDADVICGMDEYSKWEENDRHRTAYQSLLTESSQRIGKQLGINVTENDGKCMGCHGIVVAKDTTSFSFNAKDEGVTCVACHGASKEWIEEHQIPNSRDWSILTRAQKQDQKGMIDVWDPKSRVEKCLSCHVGNTAEGKVLTHAMYAAGHPPLPSIETAAFSENEPRHWQYLREKRNKVQQRLGFNPKRLEQAELVAVSGLTALTASLRLLTDGAGEGTTPAEPDFARYDCAACHHDLTVPEKSWRQARGYKGAPGRPTAPAWPMALVRVGLEAADPLREEGWNKTLGDQIREFHLALSEKPFGDLVRAKSVARQIILWADEPLGILGRMSQTKLGEPGPVVDRARAVAMLGQIKKIAEAESPDFDSARQLAWAFRSIYRELVAVDPGNGNPKINNLLEHLDKTLDLTPQPRTPADQRSIVDSLSERLEKARGYDLAKFQEDIAAMVDHLGDRRGSSN